ncbi:MAG: TetR/AcrR family transcriptional regulator [Terracidiphilus sp.]
MSTRIRKKAHEMRKVPSQERSRATVEAIVDAATHVLGRRGWAKFTTNEVAGVAGASIGSLYQYFPNKLSLIEAIRRRHFDGVIAVLEEACAEPGESSVDCLIQGMLRIHNSNPSLHKALLEDAPRFRTGSAMHEKFEKEYLEGYYRFVSKHVSGRKAVSHRVIAQVLAGAVEGTVHYAATHGFSQVPTFKREIASMVRSYLSD